MNIIWQSFYKKRLGTVSINGQNLKLSTNVNDENLLLKGKADDILLDWMTESGWIAPCLPVIIKYEINGNGIWELPFVNT